MKLSKSFIKTKKNASKEADCKNARYFERTGMVQKQMAGVYALLPLGKIVMEKIEAVVRDEMNLADGQEIKMNVLQPKTLWDETGRFEEMKDIFYKTFGRNQEELGLGPSHEEQVVDIFRKNADSYRDLPVSLYQINTKFRNEARAKSGLLRGREFTMKDMYSFHIDEKDFERYYQMMKQTYLNVFRRCGLEAQIVQASGGAFTEKFSHEFQVLTDIGEDKVYCCNCPEFKNKEILSDQALDKCPDCGAKIEIKNGIEVGNIFPLEYKYTSAMKVTVKDQKGADLMPMMGCYGIGMERLMATVVEIYFDEANNLMLWPTELSPFQFHLISLGQDQEAEEIYHTLREKNIDVLYDDREVSAGEKFADADLIGCGKRIVVSKKSLATGGVELIDNYDQTTKIVKPEEIKNNG